MLRIPHCPDSQLTDGGVVAIHAMFSFPKTCCFSDSGIHFCSRWSIPQGIVLLEGLYKLEKFNDLIRF
jgi:hypothetical protein